MLGGLNVRFLYESLGAVVFAMPSGADTFETSRFSELLAVARNYVGSAEFVDAERLDLERGPAIDFLFRSDSGTLLSIALDLDTASVLSNADRNARRDGDGDDAPRSGNGRQDRGDASDRNGSDRNRDRDNGRDGRDDDEGRRR